MIIALLAVLGVDLIVIAHVEVAAPAHSRQRALGPFAATLEATLEESRPGR